MLAIPEFAAAKEYWKMLFQSAEEIIKVISHPKASQPEKEISCSGSGFRQGSEVGGAAGAPSSAPFLLHLETSKTIIVYSQPKLDGQDGEKDTGNTCCCVD